MREKPLIPWIFAEEDGRIIFGHCNCMAGLGESCSHIGSLLWAIEAGVRIRDSMTVTQKKAYWVMPPGVKDVPCSKIKDMKFQGKKMALKEMKRRSESRSVSPFLNPSPSPSPSPSRSPSPMPPSKRQKEFKPSTEELNDFLESLASCSTKPEILSVWPGYCERFVPKSLCPDLPLVLTSLYDPENLKLDYHDLLQSSSDVTITVSPEQVVIVE